MSREKIIFFTSGGLKLFFLILILTQFGLNPYFTDHDLNRYLPAGLNLLRQGTFSMTADFTGAPTMFMTPLYPIFLALNYFSFGKFWLVAVYLEQDFLLAGLAVLVYRWLKKFLAEQGASAGALLFGLEPFSSFIANVATPESLFTFFLVLGALKFWEFLRGGVRGTIVWSGIFLGLATLTKPVAQFLPAWLIIILPIFALVRKLPLRTFLKPAAYFLLTFLLVLAPWLTRNWLTFKVFGVSSLPAYNLLFYNAAAVVAAKNHTGTSVAQTQLFAQAFADNGINEQNRLFDPPLSRYNRTRALTILGANKWEYFKIHLASLGTFLINDSFGKFYRLFSYRLHNTESITLLLASGKFTVIWEYLSGRSLGNLLWFSLGKILWLALYLLIGWRLLKLLKTKPSEKILAAIFCVWLVAYFAVLTGPVAAAIYRLPVQAFIFGLAFL